MLSIFLCSALAAGADLDTIINRLHLPSSVKQSEEINETEIRNAHRAFKLRLNPESHVIISMRWSSLEDQLGHFLFGAALAHCLNRSLLIEMRRYPLSNPQPPMLLKFRDLQVKLVDPPVFSRLRISREFYCKQEEDFRTDAPSIPILIRNFDDMASLYGNHFLAKKLRSMFGYHAGYFLAHHYLNLSNEKLPWKSSLGVDARSFAAARRMKHLRDANLLAGNFSNVIKTLRKQNMGVYIMTNDTVMARGIGKISSDFKVSEDSWEAFTGLLQVNAFLGTYRSKLSYAVNMLRGVPGHMLNTDNGDLMEMSNSLAGLLSPYIQDVEDCEMTVNEKLRGCKDNIDDLREILTRFIL
jgi:sulfur transfer complex TusBCD TusB component (DsrH family)